MVSSSDTVLALELFWLLIVFQSVQIHSMVETPIFTLDVEQVLHQEVITSFLDLESQMEELL